MTRNSLDPITLLPADGYPTGVSALDDRFDTTTFEHVNSATGLVALHRESSPWLVFVDGRPAGVYVLHRSERDPGAWTSTTYVDPAYRLAGLNRELKLATLAAARAAGEWFVVYAPRDNSASNIALSRIFPNSVVSTVSSSYRYDPLHETTPKLDDVNRGVYETVFASLLDSAHDAAAGRA